MTPMVTPCLSLFFIVTLFMVTVLGKPQNHVSRTLIFDIQGDILRVGSYYTTLEIGNPPKPYNLDIDTGSDVTWVQGKARPGAKLVKAPNAPYEPNNNVMLCKEPLCASFKHPTDYPCDSPDHLCGYVVEYADQSSSRGVVVRDVFKLKFENGTIYWPTLAFGCSDDRESPDPSAPFEDGVLGLAKGEASIVSQLKSFGDIKNVIGHCLGRQGKGFLFLGDEILPPELMWAPQSSKNDYLLGPGDLFFDGKVPIVEGIDVIVDSCTTFTHLNSTVYEATLSQIKSGIGAKPWSTLRDGIFPVCWKGSEIFKSVDEVKGYFSPLVLRFREVKNTAFELSPEDYLVITSDGNVCLGILNGTEAGLGDWNMIGAVSMLDKLVVYDNVMHMIGWAPWNCDNVPKRNAIQVLGQKQEEMDE